MKKRHTGIRNYYIYEDRTVVNEDSGKTLKPFNSGNYLKIELKVAPGVPKKFFIHRLVYKAFIGDLIDGMVVEHLDGNPQNNHYTNLKQSTQQQNIQTALNHKTFGKNNSKRITVKELNTGDILKFDTVKELISYTGISIPNGSLSKLKSRKKFNDNFVILEIE